MSSGVLLSPAGTQRVLSSDLSNPKFLFSAEARERIRHLPSTTPVPLFHPHSHLGGGLSPSNSVYSTTSSALPSLPSTSSSHLHRPQPRSPHDTSAWDTPIPTHTPHSAYPHQSYLPGGPLPYSHPPPYEGGQYPHVTSSRPDSTPRSAPFFASLAKHAPLPVLPSHSLTPSPYPRPLHSVAVYAEFDKAWMRTPLPKSVASHPMAIAHAEASRRREEWEMAEEQRQREEEWQRGGGVVGGDEEREAEATPAPVKKGGAAKLGKRPALSSRRNPSALFSSPIPSSADPAFRTPAPRGRPRQPSVQAASTEKRRITPLKVDSFEEQKEAESRGEQTAEVLPRLPPRPSHATPHSPPRSTAIVEGEADDEVVDQSLSPSADAEEIDNDSDLGDTGEEHTESDAEEAVEPPAHPEKLSPVKRRVSSNRVYQPIAPAVSACPPSPPLPSPLKPDLTLTGWFLHLKPSTSSASPSSASTVLLKGVTPTGEPWVTGYVIDRIDSTTLLTKSRRYLLAGQMDEEAMQDEGWDESGLRAFSEGFPQDWQMRVQQEVDRRADEIFSYNEEEKEEESELVKEVVEPSERPSSRPHRSPAPVKVWKSSHWTETETLRLVEAQLLHEGEEGKEMWKEVAAAVRNDRTWEECRRKFEEVKREQQATISFAQRPHITPPTPPHKPRSAPHLTPENIPLLHRDRADIKAKKSTPPPVLVTSSLSTPAPPPSRKAFSKATPAAKPRPKTPKSKATPSAARARSRVESIQSSAEPSVTNPHDMAVTVSRRSGRAVIAPLKWWETEREVNGVVVKGARLDVGEYHSALNAKERRERETREGDRWTREARVDLFLAYRDVDPTEPNFWEEVATRIPGLQCTAEECQREFQALYPTPKRRKRSAPAVDSMAEEGGEEEGQKRKRKRVTTKKRELREALARRDAVHGEDDLFDSTPYKTNKAVAAEPAPQRRGAHGVSMGEQDGAEGKEADQVLVGNVEVADAVVQRLVVERRKTKTNMHRAREEEQQRREDDEARRRHEERLSDVTKEVELQLKALDEERQQMEEEGLLEEENESDVE